MRFLILLLLLVCHQALAAPKCLTSCQAQVQNTLQRMTLDEKIGQMLLVGFRGTKIEPGMVIYDEIVRQKIGGVIFFDKDQILKNGPRNITSPRQLKKLTKDLKELSMQATRGIPLFISIDQEGGYVSRLRRSNGFKEYPSAKNIAARRDLQYTYDTTKKLTDDLNELGINLNFAPVLDVNVNTRNPVIARWDRSFSSNEVTVAWHAKEATKAHYDNEVFPVFKHFPGHGSSDSDSHHGMVDVTRSWEERELYPYQFLIDEGLATMVMTAHIFQRDIDPIFPATLSYEIMHNLLRQELGFSGVIISDDMNMDAIDQYYSKSQALTLAINAGVDIIMYGNNLNYEKGVGKNTIKTIKQLINQGNITEIRINESVERILKLKFSQL